MGITLTVLTRLFSFRKELRGTNEILRYLGRTATTIPSLYERDDTETSQVNLVFCFNCHNYVRILFFVFKDYKCFCIGCVVLVVD